MLKADASLFQRELGLKIIGAGILWRKFRLF
jgi:hypothetical protein